MSLTELSATYLIWLEAEMRDVLTAPRTSLAGYYAIMQYHMGWLDAELRPVSAPAGKRIRPLLCLLACAAAGGDPQQAVPAAAGLEILHNFSLVHDDIEDASPTRRHRATVWTLFGLPQALNAGDGMFSLAHSAFHRLASRGVSPEAALRALQLFDRMCVCLTEGQYADMMFEGRLDVSADEYFEMIAGKTGALLAAAPEIGAVIAGAGDEIVDAYRRFGAALGRAFQLRDDVLGIWGDEATTGKSAASDILSKKKTLPVLHALVHPIAGPELRRRYAGPAITPVDVPAVLALLEAAGSPLFVQEEVRRSTAEARAALEGAARPNTSSSADVAHAALDELLDTLVERQQ